MKKAVSKNIRNWNYAATILKDCLSKNIKTLEQYEASQLEFKNKKNKKDEITESTKPKIEHKEINMTEEEYLKKLNEGGKRYV